jgi:hypothetical protein
MSPPAQPIPGRPPLLSDSLRIVAGAARRPALLPLRPRLVQKVCSRPAGRPMDAISLPMPPSPHTLTLFDFATQTWEEIAKVTADFPNWSRTGDYLYYLHEGNQPSVMRVRIRDRKLECVADLKDFRQAGYFGYWLGMAHRRFTSAASRHGHSGNLRSRLASPVTHTRPSDLSTVSQNCCKTGASLIDPWPSHSPF